MALSHGFSGAASSFIDNVLAPLGHNPALKNRDSYPGAELAPYSHIYARNDTAPAGETPSVNIFFDSYGADIQLAASIVSACSDQTVYAVQCTQGPTGTQGLLNIQASVLASCGPNAPTATVTEGPSTYIVTTSISTSLMGVNVRASIAERCSLMPSSAVCDVTVSGSASTISTSTQTRTTLSGSEFSRYDVPITAGASKTASATGACSTGAASPGSTANMVLMAALAGAVGLMGVVVL